MDRISNQVFLQYKPAGFSQNTPTGRFNGFLHVGHRKNPLHQFHNACLEEADVLENIGMAKPNRLNGVVFHPPKQPFGKIQQLVVKPVV